MPKVTTAPDYVFVPASADVTPAGGQAQAVTATNAAGGVLLESICGGADFPYLSKANGARHYPNAVGLCLAPGEVATVQVRMDGGAASDTGPWPNLQVKPTYFLVNFGTGRLPTGRIKLCASAVAANVQAIFYWLEDRD